MREAMIAIREGYGLSRGKMAEQCRVSPELIYLLEVEERITHPNIATRVAQAYGLSVEARNGMCAKQHAIARLPQMSKPRPKLKKRCSGNDAWLQSMRDRYANYVHVNAGKIVRAIELRYQGQENPPSFAAISAQIGCSRSWLTDILRSRQRANKVDLDNLCALLEIAPEEVILR